MFILVFVRILAFNLNESSISPIINHPNNLSKSQSKISKKMDSQKQQKQTYLYKEIIQQNYDPEQFQEFMFSYKSNADDLDEWAIDELKDVVQKFKDSLKKPKSKITKNPLLSKDSDESPKKEQLKQQQSPKKQPKQQPLTQTQTQAQPKQSKQSKQPPTSWVQSPRRKQQQPQPTRIQYSLDQQSPQGRSSRASTIILKQQGKYLEYDYKSKHEVFSQTIECIPTTPNSLLTKDMEVKIQRFTKKEGGLFSQSYVCYTVYTPGLGVKVERRYTDFQWLKKHLEVLHPGLPIPPIAKKGKFRRYDDKHLWKRAMILEMFLNKLMEIPELKAEDSVEQFLKIADKAGWEKYKVTFKDLTVPTNLKNLKNIKGKINLQIEHRTNTFLARSQRNITQTQPELKKIYKDFKMAATMLEGCGQTLKGIARTCEQLDKQDAKFREKVELKYCPNNIFTSLGDSTTRLAEQLQKQAKTFRQLFHPLIKYEALHMLDILDSFDALAQLQRGYQASKMALIKKKLRLYEQGNMSRWGLNQVPSEKPQKTKALEIMLPKDSKQLEKLRQKYGLYNFQMYEQLNRFYTSKNFHIGRYLQQYCKHQTRISSEMMMIWVDMETNVMAMRENKFIQRF